MLNTDKSIPYGKHEISDADIDAVVDVLRSDFITMGSITPMFESAVAEYCHSKHAVATNSATSALHVACLALGIGPSDVVWTSAITFAASANCAVYCGAEVDFIDIDSLTYNLDVSQLASKLEAAREKKLVPKAVIAVHLAGQSCNMEAIHKLSVEYGFKIIEDASHAAGGKYKDKPIGGCQYSDITVFSFHPVKIITTGEGGMALTNNQQLARKMREFRSHGITSIKSDMLERPENEIWNYQQLELGFNYRLTDLQAALGLSQLKRLDDIIAKRNELAETYNSAFAMSPIDTQSLSPDTLSSFHLYIIRIKELQCGINQKKMYNILQANNINCNLHYIPVYRHPFYEKRGFKPDYCPNAEQYFKEAISIPLYPTLTEEHQSYVINVINTALRV